MVKELLQKGANPYLKDSNGKIPKELTSNNEILNIFSSLTWNRSLHKYCSPSTKEIVKIILFLNLKSNISSSSDSSSKSYFHFLPKEIIFEILQYLNRC